MSGPRVLFDTNIWSAVAKRGQGYQFNKLMRSQKVKVVMPPATLLEAFRTANPETRRGQIKLVCRKAWRRLPTEAQLEAAELVGEIRSLRPAWIRDQPDLRRVGELERFWRREVYDLALTDSTIVQELNQVLGSRERQEILNLQRKNRQQFHSDGFFRSVEEAERQLPTLRLHVHQREARSAAADGWEPGTEVAPWRYELLIAQWNALVVEPVRAHVTGRAATYADWTAPYVDLAAIRSHRSDFGHMLLYEVDEEYMPRSWLRRAVAMVQHAMKLGTGNPVDAQLSSYLVDADVFITDDRRLVRILDAVRPAAKMPFAVPRNAAVGAQHNGVAAIEAVLKL